MFSRFRLRRHGGRFRRLRMSRLSRFRKQSGRHRVFHRRVLSGMQLRDFTEKCAPPSPRAAAIFLIGPLSGSPNSLAADRSSHFADAHGLAERKGLRSRRRQNGRRSRQPVFPRRAVQRFHLHRRRRPTRFCDEVGRYLGLFSSSWSSFSAVTSAALPTGVTFPLPRR